MPVCRPFSTASLLALLALPVWAQQPPTIRVNVNLVRVVATVKDPAGQIVGTLGKDDFTIFDNGKPQDIAVFEHQTEQPLSVALMVDTSGSTAKELKYETDSVSRFFKALFGGRQSRGLRWRFSASTTRSRWNNTLPATARAGALPEDAARRSGHLALRRHLAGQPMTWNRATGGKVMIVVTDGGDTTSSTDYHRALEAAQLADAVIYPVVVMPITNDAGTQHRRRARPGLHGRGHRRAGCSPPVSARARPGLHRHHHRTAHPIPAGLLPARCAAYQGTLPQAGSAGEAARICGCRRATAIMGKPRMARAPPGFRSSPAAKEQE